MRVHSANPRPIPLGLRGMTPDERADKMIQYEIENDSLQFDYRAFYAAEIRAAVEEESKKMQRLREALEKIIKVYPMGPSIEMQEIARAALKA